LAGLPVGYLNNPIYFFLYTFYTCYWLSRASVFIKDGWPIPFTCSLSRCTAYRRGYITTLQFWLSREGVVASGSRTGQYLVSVYIGSGCIVDW